MQSISVFSQYSKICWFQQNSRGAPRDPYIIWTFFRQGITVLSFIIVGYVWQMLCRGRGPFCRPPSVSIRKSPSWIELKVMSVTSVYFLIHVWRKYSFLSDFKPINTKSYLAFLLKYAFLFTRYFLSIDMRTSQVKKVEFKWETLTGEVL